MPPRMRTQSAGRPVAKSRGGGTGVRVGRGGRGRGPRRGNDDNNLLPAILAEVGNQGNIRNQNGNVFLACNPVGCSYKEFLACNPKEYDVKYTAGSFVGKDLTWWNSQIRMLSQEVDIHGMLEAMEPKTMQKAVQVSSALINEAVKNGSIKKVEKQGNVGKPRKDKNGRDDNKRTGTGNTFATTANPVGRENTGAWPKCTTSVVTYRYPTTNNQLMNSSNPRQQATINDGRVTLQPVHGRQIYFETGTSRTYTPGANGSNTRKQRTIICNTNPDNVDNNMINQGVQVMPSSEQSNVVNQSETEITSDSNIQCLIKKEESRNIDREIALENKIKQLYNIVFKRDQSAQTVHMLTKPQFFYDHTTKQALGFQNPFYLKKAQQLEPKLYDGNVIKNTSAIVILDSEETLMLAEEIHSKWLLKQQDPMILEKKVNTTLVDYAILNQLSQDFETQFVPQTELSAEQALWSQNFMNSSDPTHSCRPTKVEVPKELSKVSMVNTSLKKLKHHLAGFDVVVKERTTATAITEGSWGY
ncbi:hypothetical protein Tco_1352352 [Tanacetum coccineum]